MLIRASLEGGHNWLAAAALLAGFLTLLSMGQVWAGAFWRAAPGRLAGVTPAGPARLVPAALLVATLVALGLFAQPAVELAQRAAGELRDPAAAAARILGQVGP